MIKEISDIELRKQIELKIKRLQGEFERKKMEYENSISGLKTALAALNNNIHKPNKKATTEKKRTLEDELIFILDHTEEPFTGRELMEEINLLFERKFGNINSFSSQLSAITQKNNPRIKKFVIVSGKKGYEVFYCLVEWFEKNNLKKEFEDKIYERPELRYLKAQEKFQYDIKKETNKN